MTWRRAPLATRRPMVRRMVRRMVMTGGGARHAGTWHPAPPCDAQMRRRDAMGATGWPQYDA
ncbi:hypothetical protein [Novacetimonas pomaceti]|uniref:hypothetical protein n=1 Tax=Novacetimonas pomaceti TaxID=2021998 RepID=UPI001C2D724D|nr:hypothetical protein [Novacetimonas pomaceti]MBV1835323.1 hypothetical protein [Novacetimonas pomaceti]